MAATNFTPISLYYSTTASAVPSAGNLVAGELALNTVDEKLYFKNSAGTVKLLASNAATTPTTPAGSNTQIQFNNSGAFGASASLTWSGTVLATLGLTVTNDATISGLTVGRGAGAVSSNTVVGASAFTTNTTGATNVAVGAFSLGVNSTGNDNTAVGYGTGFYITGSGNTGVGRSALSSGGSGASGSANTAVGFYALQANTTASYGTAVGYQAGYSSQTADYNTFIGYRAGYSTTGEQNTFLGKFAGNAVTTGTTNTIVGAYNGNQGGLDIRTLSGYVVMSDGGGTPRFYSDTNGVVYDGNGKLRAVPQSGSSKTSSYTLATTDIGEYILLGASGAIVIPDATFSAGDVITIFNNTASTATITCSITTAYIAGTFTDKATMTLAAAGVATVLFITSTLCVVSGNVT